MRLTFFLINKDSQRTKETQKTRVKVQYSGLIKNLVNRSEDEFELKEDASLSELLNKLNGIY
jgi:hypothetical protein